jgi:hypothetical protein
MDQSVNVNGFWTLEFIVSDSSGDECRHGAAVITGPKVQGNNPEWYWSAQYRPEGKRMTFTLNKMALFPGQGALTGIWADIFKSFSLYGEKPEESAKEFEVTGNVPAAGGRVKLTIRFTRVNF